MAWIGHVAGACAALLACACGDNELCLRELPACGDCGPGEVRHAVVAKNPSAVVVGTSDGIACLACERFFAIAPDARIRSVVEYGFTASFRGLSGAIAPDDN